MDDKEPHPSEALEFATIPQTFATYQLGHSRTNTSNSPTVPENNDRVEKVSDEQANDGELPKVCDSEPGTAFTQQDMLRGLSLSVPDFNNLVNDSSAATAAEHQMTLWEGIRTYPKAIGWSAMLSFTLIMEGYDLAIVNGLFAFPEFRQRYGHRTKDSGFQISTAWQSALTNGGVAGEVLGLFFNGIITEKFGYRKVLIASLLFLCCSIFLAFFAFHISMLMASELLCGLSWGVFQTLSTTYAAEVMPVTLRAYLTSNVNLCWLLGQLCAQGVLRGTIEWPNEWSYRIPFGLQWMWALPLLVVAILAPESPWWLVRNDRYLDAKKSLQRLTSKRQDFNPDETIAMMKHTNEFEKYISAGTSYWDCFKGVDLRRTEIVCLIWIIQTLSGSPMTGYATYFFTRAGIATFLAFDLSTAMYGLAIIAHIFSLFLIRYTGRRTLYMSGCGLMCATLLAAGIVGALPETGTTAWTLSGLVVAMTFFYDCTIGPICYALVAELASTRLRIKTVVLARIAYNVVSVIANILMPKMLNPLAWDLKGKACFIWAGTAFASLVWCYFRLPEPKGLTYLELDILFQRKASAKKFRQVQVNLASTGYFSLTDRKDDDKRWDGFKG